MQDFFGPWPLPGRGQLKRGTISIATTAECRAIEVPSAIENNAPGGIQAVVFCPAQSMNDCLDPPACGARRELEDRAA